MCEVLERVANIVEKNKDKKKAKEEVIKTLSK